MNLRKSLFGLTNLIAVFFSPCGGLITGLAQASRRYSNSSKSRRKTRSRTWLEPTIYQPHLRGTAVAKVMEHDHLLLSGSHVMRFALSLCSGRDRVASRILSCSFIANCENSIGKFLGMTRSLWFRVRTLRGRHIWWNLTGRGLTSPVSFFKNLTFCKSIQHRLLIMRYLTGLSHFLRIISGHYSLIFPMEIKGRPTSCLFVMDV